MAVHTPGNEGKNLKLCRCVARMHQVAFQQYHSLFKSLGIYCMCSFHSCGLNFVTDVNCVQPARMYKLIIATHVTDKLCV